MEMPAEEMSDGAGDFDEESGKAGGTSERAIHLPPVTG